MTRCGSSCPTSSRSKASSPGVVREIQDSLGPLGSRPERCQRTVDRLSERLLDRAAHIGLGEIPIGPQVDDVARDGQPDSQVEGVRRRGDLGLERGQERDRETVLTSLRLRIWVGETGELTQSAVDPLPHDRRRPA